MEYFRKKKLNSAVGEVDNFNRSPLRSQSQIANKKKNDKDNSLSRSQTFSIGVPVYSIENDPLGTTVQGPLSQASSGYLSIHSEVTTSPTSSNVSLYSEQKSDYGGSTSTVSGVSSVDSETLNIIYASRYPALNGHAQAQVPTRFNKPAPPSKNRHVQETPRKYTVISREDSFRSSVSSESGSISRSGSVRSSRSVGSGHGTRVQSPESLSGRSSSTGSTASESSSSARRSRRHSERRSRSGRHSKIVEEPDPYFTRGICSSFREDGSAEVRVRGTTDIVQTNNAVHRSAKNNSFSRSRQCTSMVRDRNTQSMEGLDKIACGGKLSKRRGTSSVNNLIDVPLPKLPDGYQPAGTLKRNAKSVNNLIDGKRTGLHESRSTGDLTAPSATQNEGKKDTFFKRGIFKLFRKKSDPEKPKKDKGKSLLSKKKHSFDESSRSGSSDTSGSSRSGDSGTIRSRSDTLGSRDGTLTRDNVNTVSKSVEKESSLRRNSRDFDRNDSLERAIHNGTLTRSNNQSGTDTLDGQSSKVGALKSILRQSKSPCQTRKKREAPPVPPHRTTRSKSTYQILDEIKAQNVARQIESMPIPDDPPTPDRPLPPSPPGNLKRTTLTRDSRSLGMLANNSSTLKRHHSRNLEDTEDDYYDLPPPPESFYSARVDLLPCQKRSPVEERPVVVVVAVHGEDPEKPTELALQRELKNTLNEPFYAKTQQRRNRPNIPPPVPPHSSTTVVTAVQIHRNSDRPERDRDNRVKETEYRPPVPAHKNSDIMSEIQNIQLRKCRTATPEPKNPETSPASTLRRRSQGNVLDNNINDEIRNVVLRRTAPRPKELELPSQIPNVKLRKVQNRSSLRNSIVMDPAALARGQTQPTAIVHQSQPNTVRLISQPRTSPTAVIQTRPQDRNSIFDALNEHSNTIKKMAKPTLARKPSFKDSNNDGTANEIRAVRKESVSGILDNLLESRRSMDSLDSVESDVDFPPPPPPICDYNTVVDC